MNDLLAKRFPKLAAAVPRYIIADLPTPVDEHRLVFAGKNRSLLVKRDDLSNSLYGGNKVRKLEYILGRARQRRARRIATFGAAGSNHALATALHAQQAGMECTCFLAAQRWTPNVARTLSRHSVIGTELVPYDGTRGALPLYRRYLQHRETWVAPLGGSSWYGSLGFVNAGLELAEQIDAGLCSTPERIYIANGTMGSVAGLAIGLAIAGLRCEIHAVRVVTRRLASLQNLERRMRRLLSMMQHHDGDVPMSLATTTSVRWRDSFYAGGYAASDQRTCDAVEFAADALGIRLETTYTGKALAALLHDAAEAGGDRPWLFWNTYSATRLPTAAEMPDDLPEVFASYFRAPQP